MKQNAFQNGGQVVGALILIGIGALALIANVVQFDVWHYLWPFIIIGFGLAFFAGMLAGGRENGALAIPGSLFVTIGLILLFQNAFGFWDRWAYLWGLIPASVGVGMFIFSRWSDKPELAIPARILVTIGLIIVVVMGLIYEASLGLLGLSRAGNLIGPVLLIVIGLVILFGRGFRWLIPSSPSTPGARQER